MLMPIVPEIMHYSLYSMKCTMFIGITIMTSIILLGITIKEKKLKFTFLDYMLVIYLLLVGISTIFTKHGVLNAVLGKNGRGEGLLTIFCYGVTFVIFSKGYKYIKWTLRVGIIAASIVTIYCILQALLPVNIDLPLGANRISGVATGTMPNQNFLSSYICIFLPMLSFNYINTGKKTSLGLTIMLFLSQIFSKTLGGYITFIAMYIVIVCYSLIVSNEKNKLIIRIVLLTILLFVSFYIIDNIKEGTYKEELSGVQTETTNLVEQNDSFGTGRMGIWRKTIMVICNYKLFGVGPDSLVREIDKEEYYLEYPYDEYRHIRIDKAHSEPLHIAVTTGIPSMIIYLVFVSTISILLLKICICNIKNKNKMGQDNLYIHMILISILSYLMQSMINISVVQVAPIFWAMLGLGSRNNI